MWMLAPVAGLRDAQYLYNGTLTYQDVDIGQYYIEDGELTPIAPLDFIRGQSVTDESGTYVDLFFGSDFYANYRVYGEEYTEAEDRSKWFVIKVPYYNLNITEESYNLYVDADGDGSLDYIDNEKIELAKLLLEYTLQEYIGANEVVLETKLADINIDTFEATSLLTEGDYAFDIIPKDSNELRISAFANVSQEAFGIAEINNTIIPQSVDDGNLFGDLLVVWDATLLVDVYTPSEAVSEPNVFNRYTYLDGITSIPTEEVHSVDHKVNFGISQVGNIGSQQAVNDPTIGVSQDLFLDSIPFNIDQLGVPLVDQNPKNIDGIDSIETEEIVPNPEYVYRDGAQFIESVAEFEVVGDEIGNLTWVRETDSLRIHSEPTDMSISSDEAFGGALVPVIVPSIEAGYVSDQSYVYIDGTEGQLLSQDVDDFIGSEESFGTSVMAIAIPFATEDSIESEEYVETEAEVEIIV